MVTKGRLLVPLLGLMAAGCESTPKVGDHCPMSKDGQLMGCVQESSALLCRDQKLVAVPCRGDDGCAAGQAPSCDMSIGQEGEPCLEARFVEQAESACSSDKTKTLICAGEGIKRRFVSGRTCRGPKACEIHGIVRCDQTAAQVGDRCNTGSSSFGVCSTDKKLLLECEHDDKSPLSTRGGKFISKRACPTAKGCEMLPVKGMADSLMPYCDYGTPKPGAPCGKGYENAEVCADGERAILKCRPDTHTFQLRRECPDGETCQPYQGNRNVPTCAPAK